MSVARFVIATIGLGGALALPPHFGTSLDTPQDQARASIVERSNEMVIELGPIDLMETSEPIRRQVVVPIGGWMHGYSVELVDAAGVRVPQRILHHAYVIAPDKREIFSPTPLYVAAAAGETEPVFLPRVIGYEMKKGDTLIVEAELSDRAQRRWTGLRLRVRFPRTGGDAFIGAIAICPFSLAVPAAPGTDGFLAPGKSESYWEGKPAIGGRILGLSAHAPRQATSVKLEDRTAKKVIWESRVDTTPTGDVRPIPVKRFLVPYGTGLDSAHVYRFTVSYANATSSAVKVTEGWGSLGGVFDPRLGTQCPAISKRAPILSPMSPDLDRSAIWR